MPVIRASLLAVFALIGLALALDLARAQGPTTGTTLHPGLNLIGWTAEPTPTSQLFREIPQLEAIWAWDAELDDWIVAARGAPEWLGGLGRITPGMGLRMQLSGDQPFNWQRSTEPTRGLVKLRTGWNLVAWSGADQTPIDDALKGIGWSLRNVHRWNPATQQWSIWTSPERTAQLIAANNTDQETNDDSEMPAIRRGEALWINVARAVNWLQPTDILPRLVFPGGASQQLQTRAREVFESVLAFFRDEYGVQANPSFAIYIPTNVETLIRTYRNDGYQVSDADEAGLRVLWNAGVVWADGNRGIVLAQEGWGGDLYIASHEYFHILQRQLAAGGTGTPSWILEGTAYWAQVEHSVINGHDRWEVQTFDYTEAFTDAAPTLRSTERNNAGAQYWMGWLAAVRLATAVGPDSWLEFWRQLAPTEIGPHGRWTSTADWQTAFHWVFDQPVSAFYTEFDAWQRERATTSPVTPAPYDGNWIRGQVVDEHGTPAAGVFVNAIRVADETWADWNQRAETDGDGSFAVRALEDGDYRLSIDINDDCTRYHRNGALVEEEGNANLINVAGDDVPDIDIRLLPNVCGRQIHGRIVGPSAEPLVGIRVTACPTDAGHCYSSVSTADGAFAVTLDETVEYRISADLGHGCSVYYRVGAPATKSNSASPITVADAHVRGILMQVPADMCAYQITGRITQTDGRPLAATWVSACLEVNGNCAAWPGAPTDSDGAFAITVPVGGTYHLSFRLDGCTVHFGQGRLTSNRDDARLIQVAGRNVQLSQRHVPAGMCAYQITGSIKQADDQPLADTRVSVCIEIDGDCATRLNGNTDDDGAFAITVPTEGRYHVWFNLEGCRIYFRSGGLTTTYSERGTARVNGRDVRLSPRQILADMCARRISGRFVHANGAPLSGEWLNVCNAGECRGFRANENGEFTIRVPADGSYNFLAQLQSEPSCWHHLDGQALGSPNSPIRVNGADVTGITLRLPDTIEELCE